MLSVVVPCFNSQEYMERALDSLPVQDQRIEVLIVDDGSTDATGEIADRFQARYPGVCIAIHQENGGHGDAIMTGLERASGLYFDVLDSDDWVDSAYYLVLLDALERMREDPVDLLVRDMVYEKIGARRRHTLHFRGILPQGQVFTWAESRPFPCGVVMLMHCTVYRTDVLRRTELCLPRHTFYVDHLYVYLPLVHVKTLYYLNLPVYHYFIGRPGQSVQEDVMLRQISHAVKVSMILTDRIDLEKVSDLRQRCYMRNYLEMVLSTTFAFLTKSQTAENLQMRDEMISHFSKTNPWARKSINRRSSGLVLALPSRIQFICVSLLYTIWHAIYQFN